MEIRPRKVQTNVIFHDVDHGINKNYNMPVGSKIDVNGLTYNVKENGTYYKGKRVNQINIHEDERLCLSTFNSTQDSVIDRNDTRVFVNGRHRNYVDDANRRLNEEGADCRIKKTQDEDGSVIDGSCDENGFGVYLTNNRTNNHRLFGVTFPSASNQGSPISNFFKKLFNR